MNLDSPGLRKFATILSTVLLVVLVGAMIGMGYRALRATTTGAYDIRWLWLLCGVALAWSLAAMWFELAPTTLLVWLASLAILCAVMVFVFDYFNILMSFETLKARGQPIKWK